jgi:crotonobetainyl-CoA:carnitine CoA-transferase CaiB-like acyl-CoA transferase
MGKLSGIKVVDLTQFLPGPMLTMMMADHGADVVKIEPPGGDPARAQAPFEGGQSIWFRNVNRGKSSRLLDLKSETGKHALWDLIEAADVVVEGFRPGVMARLGFDYAAVARRNPRIVYCSVTAFGQTGPLAQHPAHDIAVQALTGFLAVNDAADGTPVVPGAPSADMAAGLTALSAILMALIGRMQTGRGDYVDIAMFSSLLPWCAHIAGEAIAGGSAPDTGAQRSLGGAAFYNIYTCADGRHIVLGAREAKFVTNLLSALGRADLIALGEAPAGAQGALIAFLRETFARRSRDEWVSWFTDKDISFAPVLDFTEALSSPHVQAAGLRVLDAHGHQVGPAIRFANEAWHPRPAPEPGCYD